MQYLIALLLMTAVLLPSTVLADDSESCSSYSCYSGFAPCGGLRWPSNVSGEYITRLDAPPELDAVEAYRWKQAMPSARARLARLYGIPKDTAKLYGAVYERTSYGW